MKTNLLILILIAMLATALSPGVYDAILPRKQVRMVDWAEAHIQMPPGSEIKGRFRSDLFPHMIEPMDCVDDPQYLKVSVMSASRNGKTTIGLVAIAKTAKCDPRTMAFADADEKSTRRVIKRAWKMFELCQPLADQIPPRRLQASDHMDLGTCELHACWSGSPSTASDFAAALIVKNETSKMSTRKSSEADFAFLIDERAKGFPRHTILEISTPGVKGGCRIEASYLAGDRRRRYVPCPHCNHFQTLRTGRKDEPGGLRWKHDRKGHSTTELALETAWYECEKCQKKILDKHRYEMLNAGRWVRQGQRIDRRGRISGKPFRESRHASFGFLGTHYSLLPSVTWGLIAEKFVDAAHDTKGRKLRNFLNSWEGVTWDPAPVVVKPHELAERLADDELTYNVCPPWCRFLTMAADVGHVGDHLIFYWMCCGWGEGRRGCLIDYNVAFGEEEFAQQFAAMQYPHADGGPPMRPLKSGIDSGEGPIAICIYQLCEKMPGVFPLKAGNQATADMYEWGFKRSDKTARELKIMRKLGKGDLFTVNSHLTQCFRDDLVTGRTKRGDADWWSIPAEIAGSLETAELLDHLLSDYPVHERTERGRTICNWIRRGANEHGDTLRYNRAIAELITRNGKDWDNLNRDTPVDDSPRQTESGGGGFIRKSSFRRPSSGFLRGNR